MNAAEQVRRFDQAAVDGNTLGLTVVQTLGRQYHGESACAANFLAAVLECVFGAAVGELGVDDAYQLWQAVGGAVQAASVPTRPSATH